jgi:hypothetical protein
MLTNIKDFLGTLMLIHDFADCAQEFCSGSNVHADPPSCDPVTVSEVTHDLRNCVFVVRLIILTPGFQLIAGLEWLSPALTVHDHVRLGLEGSNKIFGCPAFPDLTFHKRPSMMVKKSSPSKSVVILRIDVLGQRLPVMVFLAEGLPVAPIPEQLLITTMWNDVVYDSRLSENTVI